MITVEYISLKVPAMAGPPGCPRSLNRLFSPIAIPMNSLPMLNINKFMKFMRDTLSMLIPVLTRAIRAMNAGRLNLVGSSDSRNKPVTLIRDS